MTTPDSIPRFNHVAFSVPPDLLNETGRKEIVSFYEEVFGWKELEMLRIDRARVAFGVVGVSSQTQWHHARCR